MVLNCTRISVALGSIFLWYRICQNRRNTRLEKDMLQGSSHACTIRFIITLIFSNRSLLTLEDSSIDISFRYNAATYIHFNSFASQLHCRRAGSHMINKQRNQELVLEVRHRPHWPCDWVNLISTVYLNYPPCEDYEQTMTRKNI